MQKTWTRSEVMYLIEHDDMSLESLAAVLGRSENSVRDKLKRVRDGQKVPEEEVIVHMSQEEKVARIHRLAAIMHIRLGR